MADALGLAASIIQVVSTGVQVSVYLYNFAGQVSSAKKALQEVSNDISFTTNVLEQLRATLESEKQNGVASKESLLTAEALVNECSSIFEAIMALIKKHFPQPEKAHSKRAKLDALKWPFIQPRIEAMRSNLEKHKTKLILMVQVLTFAKMVASEQRNVENQLEQEREKLEKLVLDAQRLKRESENKFCTIGLNEVFSPAIQPSVDLVFIHGMFGHPRKTWACDDTDCFWPSELLPPILEDESARILSYGYDSGAETFTDREPRHKIHDVIKSFGRDLASNRQVWHIYPDIPTLVVEVFSNASKIRKATQRPLIFVAHSMGGLIVKGVLANSLKTPMESSAVPDLHSIAVSTYGVIFLATPHNILASHIHLLCEANVYREANKAAQAIDQLKRKHTALQLLNEEFLGLVNEYQIHCFREATEPKILDDISSRLSALHEEATCIQTNHHTISKFGSKSSPGFDVVCAVIQNYVYRAPKYICSRWTKETAKLPPDVNANSAMASCSYSNLNTSKRPRTTRYNTVKIKGYPTRSKTPELVSDRIRDSPSPETATILWSGCKDEALPNTIPFEEPGNVQHLEGEAPDYRFCYSTISSTSQPADMQRLAVTGNMRSDTVGGTDMKPKKLNYASTYSGYESGIHWEEPQTDSHSNSSVSSSFSSSPLLRPPIPGANRSNGGSRTPRLGLATPPSPSLKPVGSAGGVPKLPRLRTSPRPTPPAPRLAVPRESNITSQDIGPRSCGPPSRHPDAQQLLPIVQSITKTIITTSEFKDQPDFAAMDQEDEPIKDSLDTHTILDDIEQWETPSPWIDVDLIPGDRWLAGSNNKQLLRAGTSEMPKEEHSHYSSNTPENHSDLKETIAVEHVAERAGLTIDDERSRTRTLRISNSHDSEIDPRAEDLTRIKGCRIKVQIAGLRLGVSAITENNETQKADPAPKSRRNSLRTRRNSMSPIFTNDIDFAATRAARVWGHPGRTQSAEHDSSAVISHVDLDAATLARVGAKSAEDKSWSHEWNVHHASTNRRNRPTTRRFYSSDNSDNDHRNRGHRSTRMVEAPLGGLAGARCIERARSRSRGRRSRSHSRLRAGIPVAAAGLSNAAIAGLYGKYQAKKNDQHARDVEQERGARQDWRSRSRSPTLLYDRPRAASISDSNLIQEHGRQGTTRRSSKSRSRSPTSNSDMYNKTLKEVASAVEEIKNSEDTAWTYHDLPSTPRVLSFPDGDPGLIEYGESPTINNSLVHKRPAPSVPTSLRKRGRRTHHKTVPCVADPPNTFKLDKFLSDRNVGSWDLDVTEEESAHARDEVLRLLKQWTTCDESILTSAMFKAAETPPQATVGIVGV